MPETWAGTSAQSITGDDYVLGAVAPTGCPAFASLPGFKSRTFAARCDFDFCCHISPADKIAVKLRAKSDGTSVKRYAHPGLTLARSFGSLCPHERAQSLCGSGLLHFATNHRTDVCLPWRTKTARVSTRWPRCWRGNNAGGGMDRIGRRLVDCLRTPHTNRSS